MAGETDRVSRQGANDGILPNCLELKHGEKMLSDLKGIVRRQIDRLRKGLAANSVTRC